jgi:hypoxanthine phosphoribosyltransferase
MVWMVPKSGIENRNEARKFPMDLKLNETPLIDSDRLCARIGELAEAMNTHYGAASLLVLVVLKGAVPFSVDLLRQLKMPVVVDYIRAKSYAGTERAGEVVFSHLPEEPIHGRRVLILEDILDTGHTVERILEVVRAQDPVSVDLAVLLDKPSRRRRPVEANFTGFTIEDHFVVGYGLDFNERFRELGAIHTLDAG